MKLWVQCGSKEMREKEENRYMIKFLLIRNGAEEIAPSVKCTLHGHENMRVNHKHSFKNQKPRHGGVYL